MPAAIAAAAVAGCSLLYAFHTFNRLVRLQHERHRSAWFADDCPIGFLWSPPDARGRKSMFARERLSLVWLVTTPAWAKQSEEARQLLHHMRVSFVGCNIFVLGFLVTIHG